MFLLSLDFALVQLSITQFCMCEGQMHERKGDETLTTMLCSTLMCLPPYGCCLKQGQVVGASVADLILLCSATLGEKDRQKQVSFPISSRRVKLRQDEVIQVLS